MGNVKVFRNRLISVVALAIGARTIVLWMLKFDTFKYENVNEWGVIFY